MTENNNNSPQEIIFRELQPGDKVTGFSTGSEEFHPLKIFLQNEAAHFHECNIAKTYVWVTDGNDPKVVAYVTLMCSVIQTDIMGDGDHPDDVGQYEYADYPAVKLARLCVHKNYRQSGLGKHLVNFSISISRDVIMRHVGCRFLVVDSKKSAMGWYAERGFMLLDTEENRQKEEPMLYIDLQQL